MKIGILADCFGLDFKGNIEKAAQMGVSGVQLYAVSGELAPENMDEKKRKEYTQFIKDHGLVISAICGDLWEGGFAFEDRNPGKIEATKKILDLAADMGCHIVTTHIGVVPEDENHPRFDVIRRALVEICEYALKKDVTFAIETGPEKADTLKKMVVAVNSKALGINLDPANFVMSVNEDPVHAVEVLGEYIVHTHAKDGVFLKQCDVEMSYLMVPWQEGYNEDDYSREVPLGEGQVPWDNYIAALRKVGFDGFLTIERECGEDPEKDIRAATGFLQKYV